MSTEGFAQALARDLDERCGFLCDKTLVRYVNTDNCYLMMAGFLDPGGEMRLHVVGQIPRLATAPPSSWADAIRECAELAAAYKRVNAGVRSDSGD